MNFRIFLPGLEEVQIPKMELVEDIICFHVEMSISIHTCSICRKRTRKVHDFRIQKIKHLKMFEKIKYILYRKKQICLYMWEEIRGKKIFSAVPKLFGRME